MSSLMTAWADGWSATRARPSPTVTAFGRYVDVGSPQQHGRHVVAEHANALIPELASSVTVPWTFIKAFGSPNVIGPMIPTGWTIEPAMWLMTTALRCRTSKDAALPGYTATLSRERSISVDLRGQHGEVAASGRAAIIGRWCVFDQIVTAEGHRRRGLGSEVMRLLSREATLLGADTGLLVATDDGQALYRRLGWSLEGAITSAVNG